MPATKKKNAAPDFENLLGELDEIVNRMEQGDQSLDQTMRDFERGMVLSEQCQKSLDAAQQKVEKLVEKHGGAQLEQMEDLDDDFDDELDEEYDD
ncbi:MAG: exodeoxyribonuclease VII small subunit [Acidiferrobacterales bacterium]|nr:exodeoxyribonuclease VII small subunit [Acidiferrobacterales bacterium]